MRKPFLLFDRVLKGRQLLCEFCLGRRSQRDGRRVEQFVTVTVAVFLATVVVGCVKGLVSLDHHGESKMVCKDKLTTSREECWI